MPLLQSIYNNCSTTGSKGKHSVYGPYDDLPRTISSSPKLETINTKSSTSNNNTINRRINDYSQGQWHKFDNPLYRDPSIQRSSSLRQTTSSVTSEPIIFDDAIYSASVPVSTAHSTQSAAGVGLANSDRANSPEYKFENPIYGSVNDTLSNGRNVLHTVGGTGASLMQLPNGQQRSASQITM